MRLFCFTFILLLLYRLNKCLFINDIDLDIIEEENDNNEDLGGSGDIDGDFYDSKFCDINIEGNDISYVNNITVVQAGNAYKYNISCVVNDKQMNLGDKHYTIDLILYGPNRQLKAWGNNIPGGKNSTSGGSLASTEKQFILSKMHSFGWTGPSRLMCSVKKYNHILNKFKRCEKYIYLNIQEKLGVVNKQISRVLFPSPIIQPPMFRSMVALTTANLIKEIQVNKTASTSILTKLTTVATESSATTSSEFASTKSENEADQVKIVLFAQHDNNKINRNKLNTHDPTASKLDAQFENIDFGMEDAKTKISRSILILSLFLVTFLSIIGLLVYFNYYYHKTKINGPPKTVGKALVTTTTDDVNEIKPINMTIATSYEKIEEITTTTTTIMKTYEPISNDNQTTNQLHYIDENYKNEDSIKFLPDV